MNGKLKLWIAIMVITAVSACSNYNSEKEFKAVPVDGGKSVWINEYVGDEWVVRIPPKIRKLPVTFINNGAFSGKNLISVTIPNSIIYIGSGAFSGNQLTKVVIPNSVTYIGDSAFQGNLLTSVTIGNSVTTIADNAFQGNQLTGVTIGNNVTTIADNAFANNQLTGVTIPNSVIYIGNSAFQGNQLTGVTIGNSVTTIADSAFANNQLTSVTIPNSVTYLSGFNGNMLTNITIPNSVTTIADNAFANNQLTSVTIPDSVIEIRGSAFNGNPVTGGYEFSINNREITITKYNGTSNVLVIPESIIGMPVTAIGERAFRDNQLTSVIIPDSVTTIGGGAFNEQTLTSITIGANVGLGERNYDYWRGEWYNGSFGYLDSVYNNGKQAGTYTRPNTSFTWTRRSDGQSAASGQGQVFPSGFIGTWKRDNFDNTLTFTTNTLKSSSQTYFWTLVDLSGNTFTIRDDSRVNYTARLGIRLVNGNIEISGDSGNGDNNWNGTWKKW